MSWQIFSQQAAALGVPLSSAQLDLFRRYTKLLLEANRRFNLTALRDEDSLIKKVHLDALSLLPVIARYAGMMSATDLLQHSWRAADVGSGGGAPAIPLAIAWPDLRVTLIESIAKKARFLSDVALELGLNVTVVNARAEKVGREAHHRQQYELVTARAVAALPTLAELTLPLARVGGLVALPKGPKAQAEVDEAIGAIARLGGAVAGIERVTLPGVEETRMVAALRKVAPTPEKYPRRAGVPSRKPLT